MTDRTRQVEAYIFDLVAKLTDQEREVLFAFGEGLSFAAAAASSPPTQNAANTRDSA